jgi:exopolyphosphatase/guanosine-5'-triphosphate,3'-diphosphate pyrophosphatase
LHRSHSREDIPFGKLKASDGTLEFSLPKKWLAEHPLSEADLATEVDYLKDKDRRLVVSSR